MSLIRSHILVCTGTGCTSSESPKIIAEFEKQLAAQGMDKEAQVVRTGCFGLCALGPIVTIYPEGACYTHVTVDDVEEIVAEHIVKGRIVKRLLNKNEGGDGPATSLAETRFYKHQHRIALRNCGVINPESIDEYIGVDGYAALGKILTEHIPPQQVIDTVLASGLRGRGGAGFPTGKKWQFTADAVSPDGVKYVCCNADEGDPGAFMDRSVLEGDPHTILEAMTIAGYAVGAHQGYIYVRAEYPIAVKRLETAIRQAKEYGLLGKNIFDSGFDFDLELRLGAGAFVCGEETALMRSIEGHRGEPKTRPPFPAVKGLFDRPTLLNNVETYANITWIFNHGPEAYAAIGTETSKGTKVFALGGKITNTGLVEVPMGTTLRTVVEDIGGGVPGGKKFKAAQTGGPSGGPHRLRVPQRHRLHDGLRRPHRHGRGQLHGGHRQVLSGVHCGRVLRQVLPLPHRHQAAAGSADQDHRGQRRAGGSGHHRGAVPPHQAVRPVRPGADRPQPRALHPHPFPGGVRGPHLREALPRRGVQGAHPVHRGSHQVQGLHPLRPGLPHRRHLRRGARAPHHQPVQVHQVRRVHGSLPL